MSEHQSTTDRQMKDIEMMIAEENDPKQRAFLIVLNSINNSLVANTGTIREVSSRLENHLNKYETSTAQESAMVNRGRGAWKVMAWVLGAIQAGVIFVGIEVRSDLANIHNAANSMEVRMTVLESRE